MRLTRSVSYAVSVLLNVDRSGARAAMTAAQISRDCNFPPRFLYRILRRLVDSGLLTGVSGPGGGYRLARSAKQINLQQIVIAVEGAQAPSELEPVCRGHQPAIDAVNRLCAQSARRFNDELKKTSLAAISRARARKKTALRKSPRMAARRKKAGTR